jgi:PAS domain S-box-containing protein
MTEPLPKRLESYLGVICIGCRFPAYLEVDAAGRLVAWGGNCERYGLRGLRVGEPAADCLDLLTGMLPLVADEDCLPLCRLTANRFADVHLLRAGATDWILLLDATDTAIHQTALQQQAHEIALLHERETSLLREIQAHHSHLLTIFDQLSLATAILNAAGQVEFLSAAGCRLFGVTPEAVAGRPWREVLRFGARDQQALAATLLAPPETRRKRRATISAANGGRPRWCELDIRDDPRDPTRRIVHIYDVSDVQDLRDLLGGHATFHQMIGKSAPMQDLYQLVRDVAAVNATVLIEGETGAGKELVARAIHDASNRKDGPFITVNCAGLSDSLINSQLFGHKKGAFTDAVSDQQGLFEAANGGTIFLDEIGDIPMNTQTRILRTLEQREVIRIGETAARKVDIRILAATNKDLVAEVQAGRFRTDLLYRIRVARIQIPPLRRRAEDIPLLIEAFLREIKAATGKDISEINHDTLRLMMDYSWPGNIRELRNAIEFATIRVRGNVLKTEDLPPELIAYRAGGGAARAIAVTDERERILAALQAANGRRGAAAKLLGVSRATFYRRLKACLLDAKAV